MSEYDPKAVDLTNCDREPIHQLGAIQDFGGLITVNNDWIVAQRSVNASAILGISSDVTPGHRLGDFFTLEATTAIKLATASLDERSNVERIFALELVGDKRLFDCAIHISDHLVVIEFEPSSGEGFDRQLRLLQPLIRQLEGIDDLREICQGAADRLKAMLGFDRVMVYRFHGDGSGDVIAEAREDQLEAFLGLRYPHTDIPQQARALYLRNRFRIISDINSQPVPIEPATLIDGSPLDLSMSTLRAVSPIHIEYLKNMGVGASLSISIIVQGKLWGLFACHHYSAKVLPCALRTGAELFSELFSLIIESYQGREKVEFQETGRELHDRLMRALAGGHSLLESLPNLRPIIRKALPHDGVSVFIDGKYEVHGTAPTQEQFMALIPTMNATATSRVLATNRLPDMIPAAEAFAENVVGALVIPVSRSPRDYFVLWRKELRQIVTWAGEPVKSVETGPHGDRLTPRKSFEAWQESVRGRSSEWTATERQIAESLRITLLEVILRLTDEAVQERAKAQQQQELLIAELNHRVRNILNLISGLIKQSRHEVIGIEDYAQVIGGRINALAIAHDNITRQNWSPASLGELVESESEAYLSGKLDRVNISGDDALIAPEAYTVLALVIHEMITNSAKYGSLCDRSGQLSINVECDPSGMTIRWKERGGPPVKPPERRGFGTTIIEKSIPFELNGRATLQYKLAGVEAEFWIPGRFVTCVPAKALPDARVQRKAAMGNETMNHNAKSVLLIEDSMIIALDTEECLHDLGVEHVVTQSSVAAGLKELEQRSFDLAVLDYNLGTESSERLASELVKRDIPFWLATGYGEMVDRLDEIGARGLLVKPYGREELARLLASYAEMSAVE